MKIVELYPYTTLDELSSLAHKIELQKRVKGKNESLKPQGQAYASQKPSYSTLKPFNPLNSKAPTHGPQISPSNKTTPKLEED